MKIAENIQLAEFATKFFCAKNLLENFGYPNHTLKINTVVRLPVFYFSAGRHQLHFFLLNPLTSSFSVTVIQL